MLTKRTSRNGQVPPLLVLVAVAPLLLPLEVLHLILLLLGLMAANLVRLLQMLRLLRRRLHQHLLQLHGAALVPLALPLRQLLVAASSSAP